MQELRICSVGLLSLSFDSKDSTTILPYTDTLRETGMRVDTKISINISRCDFSADTAFNLFPTTGNQILSCIRLYCNLYSSEFIQELSQHFSAVQCLSVFETESNYASMLPSLNQATQLKLLHLNIITTEHLLDLTAGLPLFSQLQEITFDDASLLPAVSHLCKLTYLEIRGKRTKDLTLYVHLLKNIHQNRHSLRGAIWRDLV